MATIIENSFRRSDVVRQPAEPGNKLVDPGEWYADEFKDSDHWVYQLSETEVAELLAAVDAVEARGLDIKDIKCDDVKLPGFTVGLKEIHDELMDGRGFVLIRGLPVADMSRAQAAAAFWIIGAHLGTAISQNSHGHVLGHVKDLGGDYATQRGYLTKAFMNFHCDQCDILGLCCLYPAKSGGQSRICSSVALHNEMFKRRPDLAKELGWKFYRSRTNDVVGDDVPWYRAAVFTFHQGYFAARGVSANIYKSQKLPGVPKFTDAQKEAMDMFKALASELSMSFYLEQGDMMFLMNHVALHARSEFEDWPEPERKRHILRLWLTTHGERPLPAEFAQQMVGIQVEGVELKASLDAG